MNFRAKILLTVTSVLPLLLLIHQIQLMAIIWIPSSLHPKTTLQPYQVSTSRQPFNLLGVTTAKYESTSIQPSSGLQQQNMNQPVSNPSTFSGLQQQNMNQPVSNPYSFQSFHKSINKNIYTNPTNSELGESLDGKNKHSKEISACFDRAFSIDNYLSDSEIIECAKDRDSYSQNSLHNYALSDNIKIIIMTMTVRLITNIQRKSLHVLIEHLALITIYLTRKLLNVPKIEVVLNNLT